MITCIWTPLGISGYSGRGEVLEAQEDGRQAMRFEELSGGWRLRVETGI